MLVSISDPVFQTHIVTIVLLIALAVSLRFKKAGSVGTDTTQELKGFAIMAILLAHVGYYLAEDTRFLFPLSVLAGVGVDLFLFLSGFGLTISALKKPLSIAQFYGRRMSKLYVPLWITLAVFFTLDFLLLGKSYSFTYLWHSFAGYFATANLYSDINSPLWYITFILILYLLFPLVFSKKWTPLSAIAIYAVLYACTLWTPRAFEGMIWVYQIHMMAFPLGMCAAWALHGRRALPEIPNRYLSYGALAVLSVLIGYFAIYSGVGKGHWAAEGISILTGALIIMAFLIKRFEVRLLSLFGLYSFEIYLLHWPILYRYDVLFKTLPASVAMIAYFFVFIGLGYALQKLLGVVDRKDS